VPDPKF